MTAKANAAYLWGRCDFHGTLSAGKRSSHPALDFPVRIPDLPMPSGSIDSIAAGDLHCVYISGGRVFGFGSNAFRQLHHLALDVCDVATEIKLPETATGKPVEVACGAAFTLVRLDDGSVMSCGNNEHMQLGHISDTTTPHGDKWRAWSRVALSVPAERVFAAGSSCFVLSDGALYSWGLQKHGHLGHGTTGELEREVSGPAKFAPVEFPERVQWFVSQRLKVAGIAVGTSHLLVRTTSGEVYGVGDNSYGKLALSSTSQVLVPSKIKIIPQTDIPEVLVGVFATCDSSFAVYEVSNIGRICYTWGKQGSDSGSTPLRISYGMPTNVTAIVGHHDAIFALNQDAELFSWGAGGTTYQTSTTMQSADPSLNLTTSKAYPRAVNCMEGKHVVGIAVGKTFAVVLADDDKWANPETLPDNATKHVMVPKGARFPPMQAHLLETHAERFEEAMVSFWKRTVGPARAEELAKEVPTATPSAVAAKQEFPKRGNSSLHAGSKVRVWMSDVYALGTVMGRDVEGFSKNAVEVQWVREDWDPEVVELASDCETLDEANEDRWQGLWFVDPPAAAASV